MSAPQTTYHVGQQITWHDNLIEKSVMEQHGPGPFTVHRVKNVPTHCNCRLEEAMDELFTDQHDLSCNVHNRRTVGHHQWVYVDTAKAKDQCMSGWWFQLYEA